MTIKKQLEELTRKLELEEYPSYVLDITHSQLDTLLSILNYYNKEDN